jgi:cytoskeletal protein CcmA (bactofilin family)
LNHVDEIACLLYLEGQLERPRALELSAHTDECAACRALLQTLERESRLLTRAMLEENEAVPAGLLAPPEGRNSVQWAWIVTFGFAATAIYVLWTGIIEPWQQQLAQAGFGTSNLLSLLFFQGAFWKGWQSMISIFETIAMVTMAGVALFFLKRRKRRWTAMALMVPVVLAGLVLPSPASAAELRRGQSVIISRDETIKNDLIVTGGMARVDGTVEGDLIVFGESLEVNGHVTGDVISFGQSARITGKVDGNVRSFANNLTITGTVGKNVSSFLEWLKLDTPGRIDGSLTAFSARNSLDGRIGRDFLAYSAETYLNGTIGGSMKFRGHDLVIGPAAEIHGTALMEKQGSHTVNVSPKAKLASPLEIKQMAERPDYRRGRYWFWKAIWLASSFLLGMVLILLVPRFSRETIQEAHKYFWAAPVGLVSAIAVLILVILACVTVVGIPLALTGLASWFLVFAVAKVVVGGWLGELILGRSTSSAALLGRVAVGMFLLRLLFMVPKAGGWIHLLVSLWGFGAVSMALFYRFQPRAGVPSGSAAAPASA